MILQYQSQVISNVHLVITANRALTLLTIHLQSIPDYEMRTV